jgi:hypothetical protein
MKLAQIPPRMLQNVPGFAGSISDGTPQPDKISSLAEFR